MQRMMKAAIWIAWRELARRKSDLALSILVTAMAVALCVAVELISAAREAAVYEKIDGMGPPLVIAPGPDAQFQGKAGEGRTSFDGKILSSLKRNLSKRARAVDTRAVIDETVEGEKAIVVGIIPGEAVSSFKALNNLRAFEAALGIELARKLRKEAGDTISIRGQEFIVKAVLAETAGRDDISAFVRLSELNISEIEKEFANEIHVYPQNNSDIGKITSFLRSSYPGLKVTEIDRGEVADREIGSSLIRYRWVIYLISALLVAVAITFESWLNVKDRKVELATLAVFGTNVSIMVNALLLRGMMVGAMGAASGLFIGAVCALLLSEMSAAMFVDSLWRLATLIGGAALISGLAVVPAALLVIRADPVEALQN